ncbi:MAG: radical SAM protein [Candidatus Riflebacteria bacterium]|nr:radical SAM protein [Candidatus Riflebacteria bacterium]
MSAPEELLDIRRLYRLPWSKNDNPNGWIEITTHCNMSCPGCYRGCDRKDGSERHLSMAEIEVDLQRLIEVRNCQTITISGGEPLMHPRVLEVVELVRRKGLSSLLLTNGKLLTRDLLTALKHAGLTGIIIRVDSLREGVRQSESDLDELRQEHADLVRSVGGLFLGFTCVIDKTSVAQIPGVIRWQQSHGRDVDFLLLILMRDPHVLREKAASPDQRGWVQLDELCGEIKARIGDLTYTAYLGCQADDAQIKWLYSIWFSLDERVLGYVDERFLELVQVFNHLVEGRYAFISKKSDYFVSLPMLLLLGLVNKSMRAICRRFLAAVLRRPSLLFTRAKMQILNIVNPPKLIDGKRDFCDACPDAVLYRGELHPSCALDEIRERMGRTDPTA